MDADFEEMVNEVLLAKETAGKFAQETGAASATPSVKTAGCHGWPRPAWPGATPDCRRAPLADRFRSPDSGSTGILRAASGSPVVSFPRPCVRRRPRFRSPQSLSSWLVVRCQHSPAASGWSGIRCPQYLSRCFSTILANGPSGSCSVFRLLSATPDATAPTPVSWAAVRPAVVPAVAAVGPCVGRKAGEFLGAA